MVNERRPLGAVGTAAAQSQLRSIVAHIGVPLLADPEVYLNFREDQIADGDFTDENFKALLRTWVDKFSDWIARLKQPALQF